MYVCLCATYGYICIYTVTVYISFFCFTIVAIGCIALFIINVQSIISQKEALLARGWKSGIVF